MRITCPACAAAYDVPDALIGTGRSLRCRSCSHAWRVAPPAVAAPPPEAPPAPPPLADPPPLPAPSGVSILRRAPHLIDPPLPQPDELPTHGAAALRLAWAASVLAVVGMGMVIWLFSTEIVEAWPPAARLYLMLGKTAQG
jgi:predicted Zn finger-like uncharacterized protein